MNVRQLGVGFAPSQKGTQKGLNGAGPEGQNGTVRTRTGTVVVRRGSDGPAEQVHVPEGASALKVGMDRLKSPPGLDAVDEWFVIEQ